MRVLVADSSASVRSDVSRWLRAAGYGVAACADGLTASALETRGGVDLVLLDARLTSRFASTNALPLVLTCPRDMDVGTLAALEAGDALHVLVKPLTRQGVLHAVRQAFPERRRAA